MLITVRGGSSAGVNCHRSIEDTGGKTSYRSWGFALWYAGLSMFWHKLILDSAATFCLKKSIDFYGCWDALQWWLHLYHRTLLWAQLQWCKSGITLFKSLASHQCENRIRLSEFNWLFNWEKGWSSALGSWVERYRFDSLLYYSLLVWLWANHLVFLCPISKMGIRALPYPHISGEYKHVKDCKVLK